MNGQSAVPTTRSSAVEELSSLPLRADNPYIDAWKEKGGKVFGYVCSYVPEELLHAHPAGLLPIRMGAVGCETTEDADVCLHKYICSFTRCLLQLGLAGEYRFLDGFVMTDACDQMRRTYEYWRDEVGLDFLTMVTIPHSVEGEQRFAWYLEEIRRLGEAIAERYGSYPTDDHLRDSIATYNRYRKLMLELYALRAQAAPKLTGAEAMRIARAGFNMPKQTFNDRLEEALGELAARPGIDDSRARIMIGGSYLDDTYLIDIIESTGAVVVTDALCSGRKYIESMVSEDGDPTEAIARRYFEHTPCPRMIGGFENRMEFTRRLAQEAAVDGVIFHRLPFCDNHAVENAMESRELNKLDVPTLSLESEYLATDEGRIKTRVQAFLEKIGR
ncbi:MAG: 2-hydroxyacyl-CoA dehydratase [Deltaproteobacteria bacterium]|nr:2-hydroxyacyl-CoA dehydratase [Deltaproteobacteria bacterium]